MGFLSDVFGGGDPAKLSFPTIPQTKEAEEARARLAGISKGELPTIPLQGIAPIPAMTEERRLARTTATELIQPQDIFSLPEVQGIIQEATMSGNLLANRLGRMLQSAGALTSTGGRDVLGRAVTDVQKHLASSLAPFAAEERRRRTGLIPVLEGLGLTEELRKQGFTQAELDALFQKETIESQQIQTFLIPLLRSIISDQPGIQPLLQKEKLSTESILGQNFLGPVLQLLLSGGGGGGVQTPTSGPGFMQSA